MIPLGLGAATSLALIVAIGAQNAFVLRQGIRREHVLPVVLICGVTDAVLQVLGAAGIGIVVERAPVLLEVIRWGGVAFLLGYAWLAARRAMNPRVLIAGGSGPTPLRTVILTCLAITYLNPHVYLDTMVLMGSIANAQGDPARWWFVIGGSVASMVWFVALGYGARWLTRFFATARSWQILDSAIAVVMLLIAARLAFGEIG